MDFLLGIAWPAVTAWLGTYAILVAHQIAVDILKAREPKENMGVAILRAEVESLRKDLGKTARAASSAALAAGLREESK